MNKIKKYNSWFDFSKEHKIKCNCGHHAKDHYGYAGFCNECGCTWYYPNDVWIERMKLKRRKKGK